MKMMSFTAPLLIVAMTVVAICGLGQLTLRASAVSTQNSIELLRMHLRVVRLHEELLRQSQVRLAAGLRALPTARPKPEGSADVLPEAGQPWPEGLGGKP
ncbi:MAG TPA: hypothetical protein VGS07_30485 [Thermoanaerobaculia bacterium]|jgi:hypothetical protein|nr:hypothetical protein [Thermoanaerobaculia bacterium]